MGKLRDYIIVFILFCTRLINLFFVAVVGHFCVVTLGNTCLREVSMY